MATLHAHGTTWDPPDGFRCPRWDYAGLFSARSPWRPARALSIDADTRRAFERILRETRSVMRSLGTSNDVFGLIHGDLIQANYIVHEDSVRPIDFGDFGRGYFLYDAAVTLLMLKPFDRSGAQRRAFIAGYREVRPLTQEHEELLDTFIAARAVVLARWALGARKRNAGDLRWVAQTLPWLIDFAAARGSHAGLRAGVARTVA
jgi:Ser/Thr protein kinase RdoA (MazF antagonist)